MNMQDIVSIIGLYVLLQLFVLSAHVFAFFMDYRLYEANKFNENRKTKRVGIKWIFWRCKKDNKKEIFTIAFIHEIISFLLFVSTTILFIITLVFNKQIILYVSIVPIFIYFCYCSVAEKVVKRKTRAIYKW